MWVKLHTFTHAYSVQKSTLDIFLDHSSSVESLTKMEITNSVRLAHKQGSGANLSP